MVRVFVGRPGNYPAYLGFMRSSKEPVLVIGCKHSFSPEGGDLKGQLAGLPTLTVEVRFLEVDCEDFHTEGLALAQALEDPAAAFSRAAA